MFPKTTKSLRRLASDHASLHNKGLPPNYLFSPSHDDSTLTSLSMLLAGPEGTPYSSGLFQLELSIPSNYPQAPPTAHFRTKIFHPNVDPSTGAICVETLKRDWKPELTLRDILVTISCLLIYPNPSSALNAEAGMAIGDDYQAFEKRATLWTKMHAAIPADMIAKVEEARTRGEEDSKDRRVSNGKGKKRVVTEESRKMSAESENDQGQRAPSHFLMLSKSSSVLSPDPFFSRPGEKPLGLGLSTSIQSAHTAEDVEIDNTPIQPPPPRRTRKRYALNAPPEAMASSSAPPSSQQPVTPTPAAPQTRDQPEQQGPVTPRPPDAKRLRMSTLTPVRRHDRLGRVQTKNETRGASIDQTADDATNRSAPLSITTSEAYSWATWYKNLPPSPPLSRSAKLARRQAERRRMEAAGSDMIKWNSGAFGVRIGIRRL